MKRSYRIAGLLMGLLVALAGCSRTETDVADAADAAAGAVVAELPQLGPAPAWSLAQLDGTVMTSAELAGKVVVVDFWATWCPPCREEIPGYVEMQRELAEQGVVIVGISLDEKGPTVVREFSERYGINYPVVMGNPQVVSDFGGISAIPTTFLIDRDGQIRHRKVGMMTRDDYEPLVRSLL